MPGWVAVFELVLLVVAVLWGLLWSYAGSEARDCTAAWVITGWAALFFIYRLVLYCAL